MKSFVSENKVAALEKQIRRLARAWLKYGSE